MRHFSLACKSASIWRIWLSKAAQRDQMDGISKHPPESWGVCRNDRCSVNLFISSQSWRNSHFMTYGQKKEASGSWSLLDGMHSRELFTKLYWKVVRRRMKLGDGFGYLCQERKMHIPPGDLKNEMLHLQAKLKSISRKAWFLTISDFSVCLI